MTEVHSYKQTETQLTEGKKVFSPTIHGVKCTSFFTFKVEDPKVISTLILGRP